MKKLLIIIFLFFLISKPVMAVDPVNEDVYTKVFEGWNLYTQSLVTRSKPIMASELIKSMNLQGGLISTVSRWESGRYEDFVMRPNGEVYGQDFSIEIGRSYFIRNYKEFNYHVNGTPIGSWHLQLSAGYNFVGVPVTNVSGNISGFAQTIVSRSLTASPEISRFVSGLFQTYVIKQGQAYGQDFQFDRFHGYVIKVDKSLDLDIKRTQ